MGQPAVNEPAPDHFQTNLSVGEILRRTRLHYNQTLPDIERALRIRASQLEALETGNYALLPGRVYVIGFIRSYSEYLGLDGDKMVGLYKTQAGGRDTPSAAVNYPVMASDTKMPQFWQIGLSIAAVGAILIGWLALQKDEDRAMVTDIPTVNEQQTAAPELESDIPPAPVRQATAPIEQPATSPPVETSEAMPPQPAPVTTQDPVSAEIAAVAEVTEEAAAAEAAPAEQAAAAPAETAPAEPEAAPAPPETQKGVILNIRQNSWVEIRGKDGKSIVSRVLKAGDRYYVPDRPDLTISLGNSGGVEFEVEGKKLKPVGATGEVKRNIPLDMTYLKKNYGQ
jgi:cytoskeleton protein RodZ